LKDRIITSKDIIIALKIRGVVFSKEKNPIGKIENFSSILGRTQPIYFSIKEKNKKN
jgi:rRNA processing protein Gar1